MKVKLEVTPGGLYIQAPDFCPFKIDDIDNKYVSPTICLLCKKCEFTTEDDLNLNTYSNDFCRYLCDIDKKISKSIVGQIQYLQKKNRLTLCIFINDNLLNKMISFAICNNASIFYKVKGFYVQNELPIAHIYGIPVYYSRRLANTELQVVGEIEWKAE